MSSSRPFVTYQPFKNGLKYIPFHDKGDPNYFFSTLYQYPDKKFESERRYQTLKIDTLLSDSSLNLTPEDKQTLNDAKKYITTLDNPEDIRQYADKITTDIQRSIKNFGEWWEPRNVTILKQVIQERCAADSEFETALRATGDAYIFEDTYKDPSGHADEYHGNGAGADGQGNNNSGRALMSFRAKLNHRGAFEATFYDWQRKAIRERTDLDKLALAGGGKTQLGKHLGAEKEKELAQSGGKLTKGKKFSEICTLSKPSDLVIQNTLPGLVTTAAATPAVTTTKSPSSAKAFIKAEGDGNCAMNAPILGLKYFILNGDLDKNSDSYTSFLTFLHDNKSRFAKENLPNFKNWEEFKQYFKDTPNKKLQETLAQPFREFSIKLILEDKKLKEEYSQKLQALAKTAIKASVFSKLGLDVQARLGALVGSNVDDLITFPNLQDKDQEIFNKHVNAYTAATNETDKEKVLDTIDKEIDSVHLSWWNAGGFKEVTDRIATRDKWIGNLEQFALGRFWQVNLNIEQRAIHSLLKEEYFGEAKIDDEKMAWVLYQPKVEVIQGHLSSEGNVYNWHKIANEEELRKKLSIAQSSKYKDKYTLTESQIETIVTLWKETHKELPTITLIHVGGNHWDLEVDKALVDKFDKPLSSISSTATATATTKTEKEPVTVSSATPPAATPSPPITTTKPAVKPTTKPPVTPPPVIPVVAAPVTKPDVSLSPPIKAPVSPVPILKETPAEPVLTPPVTTTALPPIQDKKAKQEEEKTPSPIITAPTLPPTPTTKVEAVVTPPPVEKSSERSESNKLLTQTTLDIFRSLSTSKTVKPTDMKGVVETIIKNNLTESDDVKTNFVNQVSGFHLPKTIAIKEDATPTPGTISSLPKNYCPNLSEGESQNFSIITGDAKGIGLKAEYKSNALSVSINHIPEELKEKLKTPQKSPDGGDRTLPSKESFLSADNLLQTILAGNLEENSPKNKIKICTQPKDDIQKERIRAIILLCKANDLSYENNSGLSYEPSANEVVYVKNEMIDKGQLTNIALEKENEKALLEQGIKQLDALESTFTDETDKKKVQEIRKLVTDAKDTKQIDSKEASDMLLRFR